MTAAVPVEVSITGSIEDEPSATLPNARLVGLTASVRVVCGVPVPERLIVVVGFVEELLLTVRTPLAAPAIGGLNVTWSVTVC